MCNLALVINDHALPITVSSSAPRSMVVQAPISTRSPIITRPTVGSSPSYTIVGITKAVCAYHCSGLESGNSDRSGSHGKWLRSPRDANLHRFCCFYLRSNRTDNHVIAQFNAGLNHRVSAIDTLLPSFAVASITALGAMFCAGCGVVSKICAMRA
ncbi:Uncharacterised protein [Escherichia coli]|uniref:Uncharacterized protein n=1 Tax=Escherichia coli TaxID=562 RepID=A0A376U282_ECOLX|nr:Uncharacterised protein [Escherichia coli]